MKISSRVGAIYRKELIDIGKSDLGSG